ncbi:hypothetical protein KM043_006138 [Ampulex compressa]|nr:hypothetical protein KM043_006138 [Ampulex compressa]
MTQFVRLPNTGLPYLSRRFTHRPLGLGAREKGSSDSRNAAGFPKVATTGVPSPRYDPRVIDSACLSKEKTASSLSPDATREPTLFFARTSSEKLQPQIGRAPGAFGAAGARIISLRVVASCSQMEKGSVEGEAWSGWAPEDEKVVKIGRWERKNGSGPRARFVREPFRRTGDFQVSR